MRITGGEARGRLISGPAGPQLRPTGSKVRQAFFNIVGFQLKSCHFLDICAGTGLMGMEALSRGAGSVTFVEEKREAARAIEVNLRHLGYDAEVICADLRKVIPILEDTSFDIIYADPPYKSGLQADVLALVDRHRLLADDDAVLVLEHLRSSNLPDFFGSLSLTSRRDYGQTSLSFFKLKQLASS